MIENLIQLESKNWKQHMSWRSAVIYWNPIYNGSYKTICGMAMDTRSLPPALD